MRIDRREPLRKLKRVKGKDWEEDKKKGSQNSRCEEAVQENMTKKERKKETRAQANRNKQKQTSQAQTKEPAL